MENGALEKILGGVKYIWIGIFHLAFALMVISAVVLGFVGIFMWISTNLTANIQPHVLAVVISAISTTAIEAFAILSFVAFLKHNREREIFW